MTSNNHNRKRENKSYQPQFDQNERGYQPQVQGPADISNLKPPHGGSAIEPPKEATQQQQDSN